MPTDPPLSFAWFQGIGCVVTLDGAEVVSFTAWDVLPPGSVLDVSGCEFSMILLEVSDD
jgi:hypothetical protein